MIFMRLQPLYVHVREARLVHVKPISRSSPCWPFIFSKQPKILRLKTRMSSTVSAPGVPSECPRNDLPDSALEAAPARGDFHIATTTNNDDGI